MKNNKSSGKTKHIRVQRLYRGYASVRDYIVDDILATKKNLLLECGGKKMFIPNNLIPEKGKPASIVITSKYNGNSYSLVDFKFNPNLASVEQMILFGEKK